MLRSGVARASDAQGLQFTERSVNRACELGDAGDDDLFDASSHKHAAMIAAALYSLGAVPLITLNNGVKMPAVAAGTWCAAPHHPTCTPCPPPAEP